MVLIFETPQTPPPLSKKKGEDQNDGLMGAQRAILGKMADEETSMEANKLKSINVSCCATSSFVIAMNTCIGDCCERGIYDTSTWTHESNTERQRMDDEEE